MNIRVCRIIVVFQNVLLVTFLFFYETHFSFSQSSRVSSFNEFEKNICDQSLSEPLAKGEGVIISESGKNMRNRVTYGFRSGLNISNMNFNKGYTTGYDHLSPVWRSGLHLGFVLDIPVNEEISIIQEYILSRVRGKYAPSPLYFVFDYLSIPLLIKYRVLPNILFMVGPQFELLIDGTEKAQGQTSNISKTTEERSVGLVLGLEYGLTNHWFLTGRYIHGINAIGIWQRNSRREFKYEMFQLSAGYKF